MVHVELQLNVQAVLPTISMIVHLIPVPLVTLDHI